VYTPENTIPREEGGREISANVIWRGKNTKMDVKKSSVAEPEPQGAETFGWRRSHN
jgi:hypothetical protein